LTALCDETLEVNRAVTDPRSALFKTVLVATIVLSGFVAAGAVVASSPKSRLERLDVDRMTSLGELAAALEVLQAKLSEAIDEGAPSHALQQLVLTKAGDLLSRSVSLYEGPTGARRWGDAEARALLLANRALIKEILSRNEAIIRDYQENRLDDLPDPGAFFASPAWQEPQQLISLASYWLGWNGYYTSRLLSREDPLRKEVLEESIGAFSRALIDFGEDSITSKAQFGRGLAYRQLEEYGRAAHDFRAIKEQLPRSDPLHVRCLYEEAALSFDTGNLSLASRQLERIQEEIPEAQGPADVLLQLNRLEARILIAKSHAREAEMGADPNARGELYRKTFGELKQLAARRKGLEPQLYHYVQAHSSAFEKLSYAELGAVGALAMGDAFFERKEYDDATLHYAKLNGEPPSVLPDRMDRVWFRLAYLASKNEQWDRATTLLEPFPERFPTSLLAGEAASLFHVAAHARYRSNPTPQTRRQYVASLQRYLRDCTGCRDRSEVHYQLGDHYRNAGMAQRAIDEFLKVGTDSPNFATAALHVLQFQIDQLESFETAGGARDERWAQLYQEANALLSRVQAFTRAHPKASAVRATAPYRVLLRARLRFLAPQGTCADVLTQLSGFEKRFPQKTDLHQEAMGLRILCSYRLGRFDEGKAQLQRLIRDEPIDPRRYALLQELADRFYRESQVTEGLEEGRVTSESADAALALYRRLDVISRADPDYAGFTDSIELRIAGIHAERNQFPEAIGVYEEILQRNPRSADAMLALGSLYGETGQWERALETWRRFSDGVEIGTHHWFVSRYETANALEQLGMLDRACAVAQMTLVLHPDLGDDELANEFLEIRSRTCTEETSP
jgi:tetratricopeptide (TPR) repeat protein